MLTSGDEASLLMDIKEGVQYALHLGKEEGRFTEDEIRLDEIRVNKLQYLVNEDRDLGLTFGWFKYGPAPEDVSTRTRVELTPQSETEIDQLAESRLPGKEFLSTEEFAYYFLRELGEAFDRIVTAESTKAYLEEFYAKYAPEDQYASEFTDLYIASVRLQQTLDEIAEGDGWHRHSTEYYYELDRKFLPVSEELGKHEALSHTREPLESYRELLSSIVSEADAEEELSPGQQAFVANAVRAFYNTIWDFVAQEISLETMRGENVEDLRPSVEAIVENYRTGAWRAELEALADRRSSVNLAPDIEDVEGLDAEGNGRRDGQTIDEDLIERVSEMGTEVIID